MLLDSASPIDWHQARADGYVGGLRYLSLSPAKNLSLAEKAAAHAAGAELALVYEDGAMDFCGGAGPGAAKAHVAAGLLAGLDWPAGRPVYAAIDTDLDPALYGVTWEGVRTFANLLGRPAAAYAPRPFLVFIEHFYGVKFLWELGSSSFNTGPQPTHLCLQQQANPVDVGGVQCDTNLVFVADWGQVPAPVAPPKPPTPPTPPTPPIRKADMFTFTNPSQPDETWLSVAGGCYVIGGEDLATFAVLPRFKVSAALFAKLTA
jgi:hypothetical protein